MSAEWTVENSAVSMAASTAGVSVESKVERRAHLWAAQMAGRTAQKLAALMVACSAATKVDHLGLRLAGC